MILLLIMGIVTGCLYLFKEQIEFYWEQRHSRTQYQVSSISVGKDSRVNEGFQPNTRGYTAVNAPKDPPPPPSGTGSAVRETGNRNATYYREFENGERIPHYE